jgi:hypothetical protein
MEPEQPAPTQPARGNRRLRLAAMVLAAILLAYFLVAYVALPLDWTRYMRRHPALADMPGVTHTADGIPGDPLNVALVGSEAAVRAIMLKAKWYPADPLSLKSDLRIAADSVLERSYDQAPVSNLFLFGRKEDLAYEQPVGPDPRQRHHVRFWKAEQLDTAGRPLWIGAVTFDERVGLSHTTGQITHHISPDVDGERDRLFKGLTATGDLADEYSIDDFHQVRQGRNGGGDPWRTDGRLMVGVIE